MTFLEIVGNAKFSVLLGKNGSGKSTRLRELDNAGQQTGTKYISPERGGTLKYDPNVDLNISNNDQWLIQDRRKNRTEQFRQQSAAQFRNLETLVLREIEQDIALRANTSYSFNATLAKINQLLPAIELRRADRGFKIHSKTGVGDAINEDDVSSGEAELIALAIEVLVFARESKPAKILLLDEPDVHLHPDLQQKFIAFIESVAVEFDFKVVVATHSTAIIGAFSKSADLQVVPVSSRMQTEFKYFKYSPICHEILPIFGAHPLSAHFNRSPVLLVEGEDDKRVIDQFVRSSNGRYVFSPCVVGTVDDLNKWELWLSEFLPAIYDNPVGFSLRDLDSSQQTAINNVGCVKRVRLNCYAIENFLLSNECLANCGHQPETFRRTIAEWATQRPSHPASPALSLLSENFTDRRTTDLKDVRNVLVALLGVQKPWEVLVGQVLAANNTTTASTAHSVNEYLGPEVISKLLS